jgi:hypothetical protein
MNKELILTVDAATVSDFWRCIGSPEPPIEMGEPTERVVRRMGSHDSDQRRAITGHRGLNEAHGESSANYPREPDRGETMEWLQCRRALLRRRDLATSNELVSWQLSS